VTSVPQRFFVDAEKKLSLLDKLNNMKASFAEYRIGPIYYAHVRSGINQHNYAASGTYYATEKAVSNLALLSTKATRPYPIFKTGESSQRVYQKRPMLVLSERMHEQGKPSSVIFNFEYNSEISYKALKNLDLQLGWEGRRQQVTSSDLVELLRERGEVVTAVKVDGNSLARALAHQLAGSEEQHSRIRAVIAQSFAKNREVLYKQVIEARGGSHELNWDHFVADVAKDGTPLDYIAIHALALSTPVQVQVYLLNDKGFTTHVFQQANCKCQTYRIACFSPQDVTLCPQYFSVHKLSDLAARREVESTLRNDTMAIDEQEEEQVEGLIDTFDLNCPRKPQ